MGRSYFHDATLRCHDHGLRPVIHVEAAQDDVDVPFYGSSCDTQRVGNLLIVEPLNDQTQNVQLAGTQGGPVQFSRHAVSNAAWKILVAGTNASYGIEQLQVGHSLHQISLRPGSDGFPNVLVTLVGSEH